MEIREGSGENPRKKETSPSVKLSGTIIEELKPKGFLINPTYKRNGKPNKDHVIISVHAPQNGQVKILELIKIDEKVVAYPSSEYVPSVRTRRGGTRLNLSKSYYDGLDFIRQQLPVVASLPSEQQSTGLAVVINAAADRIRKYWGIEHVSSVASGERIRTTYTVKDRNIQVVTGGLPTLGKRR